MPEQSGRPARIVLVADGGKALFLRNSSLTRDFRLAVDQVIENENPATREQGTDQPGRALSATGGNGSPNAKSAMEETDWHRLGKERFAADIAGRLDSMAEAGELASVVIVAPPLVLGVIRKALSRKASDLVEAEIAKDLTGLPVPDIEKILAA